MDPASRRSMPVEHISAGIGAIVRDWPSSFAEMPERGRHEPCIAAGPETIADNEFRRSFAGETPAQRRHRMEIDQQGCTPMVAQCLQRRTKCLVVGPMDRFDPLIQFVARYGAFP